ncbi:polysaccharide biosynthesis protein [Bacillus luteolus]|uniref:Polysaccharide biosynthesis protein n=1 Tax=Litchfieldia luteola TaxID=682179 RepID=A0ABR9QDV5_9BACI|nr:polysaccharide biosynthesis protein [Cytobacillus luteolus]MBE4906671.1 polysaccharide biosynthesis protein [Cytobacillus luteolus]MBP1944412.1 PST family polysaccharide transporter [Cytobacillus luteolus]
MSVQSKRKIQGLVEGAFILTIAGIIIKILSAAYRVPYQNIVGDIGFYIYQQIYPIYGIALVLSTYGFPVVISKLIAERYEHEDDSGAQRILIISFFLLSLMGIVSFSFLYWGAGLIAGMMGDNELSSLIKVTSFSFLLLPVISLIRGYFQGRNNMIPTATSQIVEQLVRVVTILLFSYLLLLNGYSVYEAGAGAIFGSVLGGFTAILVLFYFLFDKKTLPFKKVNWQKVKQSSRGTIKVIVIQGFTISVSGLLLIVIQLVDSFTLYSLLVSNGIEETSAKTLKGVYDRGQPLIQLGTVVATSLSLTLVPLIASAKKREDFTFIIKKVSISLKIAVVIGVGAAVGLASIITPTNRMLFQNSTGSQELMILVVSIFFTTIILTISAILNGLGYSYFPAISVIIGVFIKMGLNMLLIPSYSILGAALATVIAFLLVATLNGLFLYKKLPIKIINNRTIAMTMVAAGAMVSTLFIYQSALYIILGAIVDTRLFSTLHSLSAVLLGGLVYILVIIRGNVFTREELSYFPLGEKASILLRTRK